MLIEAEIVTNCNQWPITYHLAIRSKHDLQASAKIQVLITCSTYQRMPPNWIPFILEGSCMVVNQAGPRVFADIGTDTAMNREG